jgi:hypothetical protein
MQYSLTQAIRQFATQLSSWLESSLAHFPEKLKEKKMKGKWRHFTIYELKIEGIKLSSIIL